MTTDEHGHTHIPDVDERVEHVRELAQKSLQAGNVYRWLKILFGVVVVAILVGIAVPVIIVLIKVGNLAQGNADNIAQNKENSRAGAIIIAQLFEETRRADLQRRRELVALCTAIPTCSVKDLTAAFPPVIVPTKPQITPSPQAGATPRPQPSTDPRPRPTRSASRTPKPNPNPSPTPGPTQAPDPLSTLLGTICDQVPPPLVLPAVCKESP